MNTSARFHCFFYKFLLLILIFSLVGCGGAEISDLTSPPANEGPAGYEMPRLLGFVIDPDGDPVAFAEVGGEDIATEDGVASGDFLDYQGGWIPVTALGYASGYAKDSSKDLDFPFFVTHLTPYQSMGIVEVDNPLTLRGIFKDEIYMSAELSAGLFQDPSVVVGMALIDPYDVSPIMEPFSEGDGLKLKTAFALEAFDEDRLPVALNPGAVIPLTLEMPNPLSEEAKFARFDRASGEWQSLDLGCEKGEGDLYTCQLDTLDPLIGVFDQAENQSSSIAHSPRVGSPALEGETNYWHDLAAAIAALQDWVDIHGSQEGGINPTDPELIALVEKIAEIAQNYAKNNRNESGKAMLADAAGHAGFGMQDKIVKDLTDEMASIAEELAKEALKEENCTEYSKMEKAAEQVQLLKADFSLASQVMEKAVKMAEGCDVWEGIIRVVLPIPSTHPSGLDLESQYSWNWVEVHTVKISTHTLTHVMEGESNIAISFPLVRFERNDPCPKVIEIYNNGSGSSLAINGGYDGYKFTINELIPIGGGSVINHYWRTEAKVDGVCEVVEKNGELYFSFPNFHSVILHGVIQDNPPISYFEILDYATISEDGYGLDQFSGRKSFANPEPSMGVYPYLEGQVHWQFYHTVKALPLKAD